MSELTFKDVMARLSGAARTTPMHFHAAIMEYVNELRSEKEQCQREAPLCAEHGKGNGTRSGCLVCGLEAQSAALSAICYAVEEPNAMGVSTYDVAPDEQMVVERVKTFVFQSRFALKLKELGFDERLLEEYRAQKMRIRQLERDVAAVREELMMVQTPNRKVEYDPE